MSYANEVAQGIKLKVCYQSPDGVDWDDVRVGAEVGESGMYLARVLMKETSQHPDWVIRQWANEVCKRVGVGPTPRVALDDLDAAIDSAIRHDRI